jgi:hypothetical protein
MSIEKSNQPNALNDVKNGQFGKEPLHIPEDHSKMQKHVDEQKIPRKFSKKYVKVSILSHNIC